MFLATDALVVGLRALLFVALFQAAGAAIFRALFGKGLSAPVASRVRRLARMSAFAALVLTVLYVVLSPARLAGSFDGVLDASLQSLMLGSSAGKANIVRAVGLALLAIGLGRDDKLGRIVSAAGIGLALISFLLMGHTSVHAWRWLLAPLLLVHLVVVAGWFGALVPLSWIARDEPAGRAATLIATFSTVAAWTVPLIFVCGLIIAAVFIGSVAGLFTVYGALIAAKILGFAVLMALAAANKWRFGPAIAQQAAGAAGRFVRTATAEAALIAAILVTTAVLTSLFAPAHLHASASRHLAQALAARTSAPHREN